MLKFLGCNQIEMGPFTKANDVVLIFGNKVLPIKYHQCPIKHHPSNITHQISPIKRIFHHKLLPFVLFPLLLCWPSKSAISYQLSITSDTNLLFSRDHFLFLWDTRHHFVVLYLCNNHLRWKLISRGRCHSASLCQGYLLDQIPNRNWGEGGGSVMWYYLAEGRQN